MQNCDKSITNTVSTISDILRCVVASVSVFGVVVTVDWLIAVIILGFSIVTMILNIIRNGIYYKYQVKENEIWRKQWYSMRFFSLAEYSKEIRLTDVSENVLEMFNKCKKDGGQPGTYPLLPASLLSPCGGTCWDQYLTS